MFPRHEDRLWLLLAGLAEACLVQQRAEAWRSWFCAALHCSPVLMGRPSSFLASGLILPSIVLWQKLGLSASSCICSAAEAW